MKVTTLIALLLLGLAVSAQPGTGNGPDHGKKMRPGMERNDSVMKHRKMNKERKNLGLNEDQKKKIKESRMKFHKDAIQLRNVVAEKKAHLRTLSLVEKPDQTQIDKTIDEMMAIQAQIMKKRSLHQQEIRSLLTEEQRMAFDMKKEMRKEKKKGKHVKKMRIREGI
jgi:Spy/CpxP family protein refolding chaperone